MKENWDKAIKFVLQWEAGYVDDSVAGATKYGISQRAYPTLNIETLTPDEAMEIYRADYWNKCGCDNLAYPWDIITFDSAVNCGVSRAMNWLAEIHDWRDILLTRVYYYTSLAKKEKYRTFLRGWLNRTTDLYITVR